MCKECVKKNKTKSEIRNRVSQECSVCKHVYSKDSFSAAQWKKKVQARCKLCIKVPVNVFTVPVVSVFDPFLLDKSSLSFLLEGNGKYGTRITICSPCCLRLSSNDTALLRNFFILSCPIELLPRCFYCGYENLENLSYEICF